MPHTISHKTRLPLLAGACALALALMPTGVLAAGGGGGHMGGMSGMTASHASMARPMVAPPDRPINNPASPDTKSHAPFGKLGNPSEPQPGSPSVSSHAPLQRTAPPPTGTRLPPPTEPSAPRLDPPPG